MLAGCGDQGSSTTPEQDTLVVVSPEEFLGDVACAEWPGAMRRYSATLIDVTDDLVDVGAKVEDFALPSSAPVDCRYPVGFGRVVIGHRYVAHVEGYDRVDIEPAAPGSPLMLDPETGDLVPPRWQTACGRAGALGADGPISPIRLRSVFVTGCEPLRASSRPPLSAVSIQLDVALGALSCTSDGGEVDRFEVRSPGSKVVHGTQCDAAVELVSLTPGALVELQVDAYGKDDQPRWTTTCQALPEAGAVVAAGCDLLSEEETVRQNE
jgi:hypothetical protein